MGLPPPMGLPMLTVACFVACRNERTRDQRDRPDLSNPETLNQCLETRFEQLNVACALEMWQEAFRSIEDIHGLWALNKKMPKCVPISLLGHPSLGHIN